jgi:lipopolysaccharide/colanic/teichoic acid biosynthesis glycosyltransferase
MEAHQLAANRGTVSLARRRALAHAVHRSFDLLLAALTLVLLAPLILAIVLLVRADSPGPAFFRQRRVGRGGREFTMLKFRTMRADADVARHRDYVHSLIRDGGAAARANGLYKLAVDDRITRLGRLMRKLSLDELPQLWNVVRGDMSIVGPRPVIAYEVDSYPDWWFERFDVKPGITGLWQVSGRSERTYEEMVRLDIDYARRQSLRGDVAIVLKTVVVVLKGKGAA